MGCLSLTGAWCVFRELNTQPAELETSTVASLIITTRLPQPARDMRAAADIITSDAIDVDRTHAAACDWRASPRPSRNTRRSLLVAFGVPISFASPTGSRNCGIVG